jgi:hypothetical protein
MPHHGSGTNCSRHRERAPRSPFQGPPLSDSKRRLRRRRDAAQSAPTPYMTCSSYWCRKTAPHRSTKGASDPRALRMRPKYGQRCASFQRWVQLARVINVHQIRVRQAHEQVGVNSIDHPVRRRHQKRVKGPSSPSAATQSRSSPGQ